MTSVINGIDDQRMYFKILQYMTKHDHFVSNLAIALLAFIVSAACH